VQVGTVIFNDPSAPIRVVRELGAEMAARGHMSVKDVVGLAHRTAEVEVRG
jgi:dihydroorotate dehydrogenase (NAD+) catalytic subunit